MSLERFLPERRRADPYPASIEESPLMARVPYLYRETAAVEDMPL